MPEEVEEEEAWMKGPNRRQHPAVWKASQLAMKAGVQLGGSAQQDQRHGTMIGRNRREGEQHVVWRATQMVKDGTLLNSMSSLTSKVSTWGTGWLGTTDQKTTASEGGPGEGTSLLATGGAAGKRSRGQYQDMNEKPLLGSASPSPDKDSWNSWGDDWGAEKKSPSSPTAPVAGNTGKGEGDWGDDWSNQSPDSPTNDDWNTEDWGNSVITKKSSSSTSSTSASTAAAKKKKKPHGDKKKTSKPKSQEEAATGNLIDFGDISLDDKPKAKNGKKEEEEEGDGWDNEKWADEDDAWQSLE